MFNQILYFTEFEDSERIILLANGSQIAAKGIGTVKIELPHSYLKIEKTLYCPDLSNCLLIMGSLLKNHYILQPCNDKKFKITDQSNRTILDGDYSSSTLIIKQLQLSSTSHAKSTPKQILTLHQSSGHPSFDYFAKMYPHLDIQPFSCLTCNLCKMTKKPFPGHFPLATTKGETLHLDLCGPITPASKSGAKYCLRVVNSFSRYVWILFLQKKSEAKEKIKNLILKIQQTPLAKISNNPVAERGNQTAMNKAICLLKDSGLPLSYWAEVVNTAVYLENLTPNSSINFEKPFRKWYCQEPLLRYLHPFGCLGIYYNNYINGKFSNRGVKGVFLGYREGHHSFRILDVEKGNVILSHHVKFNYDVFPYKYLSPSKQELLDLLLHDSPIPLSEPNPSLLLESPVTNKENPLTSSLIEPEDCPIDISTAPTNNLPTHKGYTWFPETCNPSQNKIIGDIDPRNILNKSRRKIHSTSFVSTINPDPKTYMQALHSPEKDFWIDTIRTELDNMAKHQVWTPLNHPPNLKPLSTTWVFKKKTNENSNLTKFKA
ncbi:hypothetical protein O181_013190 [Austropuccinia psidii MF-1]|uniref:Integrase catalytic domain-containing protein n=1 Tax=Austropuccinia psidii MF-1 TaxID=1389203 RepID=A0A9Q3BZD2_9BASI|nr:hypothetical protein [Austropuccinia psidii MF-1]